MSENLPDAEELSERIDSFYDYYFLIGAKNDREAFYALTEEELKKYPLCQYGVFLNLVMDGELDKAWDLINSLEDDSYMKYAMTLVHPKTTFPQFISLVEKVKEKKMFIPIVLTGGRPSLLNGVADFSRIGPFLEKKKDRIIAAMRCIYEPITVESIYKLCLAEYYYYHNMLIDAEILVSRTIHKFNKASEKRLLFAALYLQSKILIASGKPVDAKSFIKNIRNYVKQEGEVEFSFNIDAVECMFAFFDNEPNTMSKWLKKKAPDEYADFNMLDLFRYMIKIRCYIVYKQYTAAIALAERLRPLLIEGNRFMDLCELDVLLAINFFRSNEKASAFEALERALKFAKRYGYYRLIADEGDAILPVLLAYINEKGLTLFARQITEITRSMALSQPWYLRSQLAEDSKFTRWEKNVLVMLDQGRSIDQMSQSLFLTKSAIKFHLKRIYRKLDVKLAHQAVCEARRLGII